jgi:hypothetical protein
MSAKSDYIVLIDAGQACICNQYGGVRNRVGDYGATSANISSDREFFIVSYRDYVYSDGTEACTAASVPDSMLLEPIPAVQTESSSTK